MQKKTLGKTKLMVSRLGIGLAEIGSRLTIAEEERAAEVLNAALDAEINFLDTAACYGTSEELIGRTISKRRGEFILSTKAGHAVDDEADQSWTYQTIRNSIERSLRRMQTDYIDIVHLHSCDVDILEKGEAIRALQDARQAGTTRFIGYSGDNEAAGWAVASGIFDTLQTSFNLVDQKARLGLLSQAHEKGMGVIVKRPVANGAWGAGQSPSAYASEYFRRYKVMIQDSPPPDWSESPILLALGFVYAHDEVDTAIVGTSSPPHLQKNIQWVEHKLPLNQPWVEWLHQRFDEVGKSWPQKG